MDESSAFLLVGLGFFLVIFLLAQLLENSRHSRANETEHMRNSWRVAEQREFGFDAVTERNANQQSIRRHIK